MKKLFNLVLLITLIFIGIGSTFNNVDASAGDNNKSRTLTNLIINGDFSDGINNWSSTAVSFNVVGEIAEFLVDDRWEGIAQSASIIEHYYYLTADYKTGINISPSVFMTGGLYSGSYTNANSWETVSYIDYANTGGGNWRVGWGDISTSYEIVYTDNIMVFDLTLLYGSGNEPTLSEFETILEDAPDYFDEWTYNYYEEDSSIGEFACERYADNIIDNGNMSLDSNSDGLADSWVTTGSATKNLSIVNNFQYVEILSSGSSVVYQNMSFIENHLYYTSLNYDNSLLTNYTYLIIGNHINGNYYDLDNVPNISYINGLYSFLYNASETGNGFVWYGYLGNYYINDKYGISNIMLFDLTAIWGVGNEPSIEEWEIILNANTVDGYTDGFTFDDTCYMTIEQHSPVYQYYDNIEGIDAEFDITMTETILEMDDINPLLYIVKYNLNMNYQGIIYDGNISTSSVNAEGYVEHTFNMLLPSPVSTEDGYIYIAYDEAGGEILAGGYVFDTVSDSFKNELIDEEGVDVRSSENAIAINNSPYLDMESDYQFDNNYNDYMFNDNDNFILIHARVDSIYYSNEVEISFYSENTDQFKNLGFQTAYEDFCDITYKTSPVVYDCVFYVSEDNSLPALFDYLNTNTIYDDYLIDVLADYNEYYTEFLINVGYVDNNGYYTYNLTYTSPPVLAVGETPLYYFDYFYTMDIVSHEVRNGRNLFVDINKDSNYLDQVATYQFLYDNNTGIYEFDINENEDQRIMMEVFDGLTPDDVTVYYHLKNVDIVFNNGASDYAYDVYMSDSYVLTVAESFPDKVDTWMDMLNMNSALGKIIIASVILILATIGMWFATKNVVAILFVDFAIIALLAVLDIIPLWIILFMIMLFFGGLFIKNRGGAE